MTLRKNTRKVKLVVPPSDPHTEPEFVEMLGSATFHYPDEKTYSFSVDKLPYPQIAKALLASTMRIFNSRGSERHNTIKGRITAIQVFCKLAEQYSRDFVTLQDLTGDDLEWFENAVATEYPNGRSAITYYTNIASLLQECSTVMDLREDLKYRTLRPSGNLQTECTPIPAYSAQEIETIREVALNECRRILEERRRDPFLDASPYEKELLTMAIEGKDRPPRNSTYFNKLARNKIKIIDTYHKVYPISDDLVPFAVLLACITGWNVGVILGLQHDCLVSENRNRVGVNIRKPRRQGKAYDTIYVTDGNLSTPGGVIRAVLEMTQAYRKVRGGESLWLAGGKNFEEPVDVLVLCRKFAMDKFVAKTGLLDAEGKPMHLQLSKLRKTVKLEEYQETKGVVSLMKGHSATVAARHYVNLPQSVELHLNALSGAVGSILHVVSDTASSPEIEQTILTGCKDKNDSPFTPKGQTCMANPAFCLACPNAQVSLENLPGLLSYIDYMANQATILDPAEWVDVHGTNWLRINEHILPNFNEQQIASAEMMKQPHIMNLAFEVLGKGTL